MATVRDILAVKGTEVLTIPPGAMVRAAAQRMNDRRVGALVVAEGERVVGIFTERDILRRVVAEDRDPAATAVEAVMTTEVACARPETTLAEARGVMKHRRIRHLPVVDEARVLRGLISIGDLNAHDAGTQELTIHFLEEYLYGTA